VHTQTEKRSQQTEDHSDTKMLSEGVVKPVDERSFQYSGIPEEEAWFISRLLFAWETPLFQRAAKLFKREEALQQEDLLPLPRSDYSDVVAQNFEEKWSELAGDVTKPSGKKLHNEEDIKAGAPKIRKTIARVLGWRFVWAGVVKAGKSYIHF
jgi:hypothetical protein